MFEDGRSPEGLGKRLPDPTLVKIRWIWGSAEFQTVSSEFQVSVKSVFGGCLEKKRHLKLEFQVILNWVET